MSERGLHDGCDYMAYRVKGDLFCNKCGFYEPNTTSHLISGNYEVVIYPDACLEPGEAVTHTTGS